MRRFFHSLNAVLQCVQTARGRRLRPCVGAPRRLAFGQCSLRSLPLAPCPCWDMRVSCVRGMWRLLLTQPVHLPDARQPNARGAVVQSRVDTAFRLCAAVCFGRQRAQPTAHRGASIEHRAYSREGGESGLDVHREGRFPSGYQKGLRQSKWWGGNVWQRQSRKVRYEGGAYVVKRRKK